jgi:hypothetical protein
MTAVIVFGTGPGSRRSPIYKIPPVFRVLENEQFQVQSAREKSPPRSAIQKPKQLDGEAESETADGETSSLEIRATKVKFADKVERETEREPEPRDYPSGRPTKSSQIRTVFRHGLAELNEFAQDRERSTLSRISHMLTVKSGKLPGHLK